MSSGYAVDSNGQASLEYLETIALLQEEITRLESQLLDREEAGQAQPEGGGSGDDDVAPGDNASRQELARLGTELAARDETINLLLDQLQLVEEAEVASRAEWEQLASWVTEVEERVDRQQGAGAPADDAELSAHRRLAEECRTQLERERESWRHQRLELQAEIERLEEIVTRPRPAPGGLEPGAERAIAALEADNRRLRRRCQQVEEKGKAEALDLRASLDSARQDLGKARGELGLARDERDRERREFEIAMASLRAQSSRASLAERPARECGNGNDQADEASPALEADMRIRAFRQHLREIHRHEAEARKPIGLSERLSRLWSRTRPG